MEEITVELGADGGIAMLHSDLLDLGQFGQVQVRRASNVEFDGASQAWFVQSARTGEVLRCGFRTRAEALAWEHGHYSPGGAGWGEAR